RSRSNSTTNRSSSNQNDNSNPKNGSSTSITSRPNSKGRNVSYANAAAGPSNSDNHTLDDSIHSPKNKGKDKENSHQAPPAPLVRAPFVRINELDAKLSEAIEAYNTLKDDLPARG